MTSFYEQLFKTSLFRNTSILKHTFNQKKKKKNHQTHNICNALQNSVSFACDIVSYDN